MKKHFNYFATEVTSDRLQRSGGMISAPAVIPSLPLWCVPNRRYPLAKRPRRQHEHNEKQLTSLNNKLGTLLDQSNTAIANIHLKQQRQSELHIRNRKCYGVIQHDVVDTSVSIDSQLIAFQAEQQRLLDSLSARTRSFIDQEVANLSATRLTLEGQDSAFSRLHQDLATQTIRGKDQMDKSIKEVGPLKERLLKTTVETGIAELGAAVRRTLEVTAEDIGNLQAQLQRSHSVLSDEL